MSQLFEVVTDAMLAEHDVLFQQGLIEDSDEFYFDLFIVNAARLRTAGDDEESIKAEPVNWKKEGF